MVFLSPFCYLSTAFVPPFCYLSTAFCATFLLPFYSLLCHLSITFLLPLCHLSSAFSLPFYHLCTFILPLCHLCVTFLPPPPLTPSLIMTNVLVFQCAGWNGGRLIWNPLIKIREKFPTQQGKSQRGPRTLTMHLLLLHRCKSHGYLALRDFPKDSFFKRQFSFILFRDSLNDWIFYTLVPIQILHLFLK